MNDDDLLALMKLVDSQSVRVPPGVRKIVDAAISAEREACAGVAEEECCDQSEYRCRTIERIAAAIRARSNAELSGIGA